MATAASRRAGKVLDSKKRASACDALAKVADDIIELRIAYRVLSPSMAAAVDHACNMMAEQAQRFAAYAWSVNGPANA